MTKENFIQILRIVASRDTSADPENWTPQNPLWGHCAVVSLLAQDYFGGSLVRGSLAGNSKYSYLRSHYWNLLSSGEEVDFTSGQYADLNFSDLPKESRDRDHVLSYPNTQKRYLLLKNNFEKSARDALI